MLYLGAASGTTVSHVSDLVGPVSRCFPAAIEKVLSLEIVLIELGFSVIVRRMVLSMRLNFLTEVVGIWSTWRRSVRMLSRLLRMQDILPSTECLLVWWMLYSLMLLNLTRSAFSVLKAFFFFMVDVLISFICFGLITWYMDLILCKDFHKWFLFFLFLKIMFVL